MAKVLFKVGSFAAYSALATKDENSLYFITDAKKIFKGDVDVTESIIPVTEFPEYANAFNDKLYINASTLEVKTKITGQADYTVIVPGYISAGSGVTAANNTKIVTVKALIEYIAGYASISNGTITIGGTSVTPIPVVTGETGEVPKFKSDGTLESSGFTLGKSVPSNAVFTDTTYSAATASAEGLMSAADKSKLDGIAAGANKTTVDSSFVSNSTNPVQSKVVKAALDNKLETSLKGAANGLAELDANGKVPSTQLPSYVDDVIEGYYYNSKFYKESAHTTEITGESGKIYVNLAEGSDQNKTYRWSGSAYVVISETLALGETASTAYRGDRGKAAFDHTKVTSGNPHNVSKSDVGLGNVTNNKQVKAIESAVGNNVVLFSGIGGDTIKDSGKKIGSTTLANSPDSDTLATEIAVKNAVDGATSIWRSIE